MINTRQALEQWLAGPDPRTKIIDHLLTTAGIRTNQCGLGGSTGLGCETPNSDIDLLVFGCASTPACRHAIEDALLAGEISLMAPNVVSSYAKRYARLYNIDQNYLHTIFANDLTKIYYRGQKISFIFAYNDNEREKIPSCLYTETANQKTTTRFKARIVDGTASWMYPRKYTVEQSSGALFQVWSHHWLRDPVTSPGTLVEVVGNDLGNGVISLTDIAHHIVPLIAETAP